MISVKKSDRLCHICYSENSTEIQISPKTKSRQFLVLCTTHAKELYQELGEVLYGSITLDDFKQGYWLATKGASMTKIIRVESCGECPHIDFSIKDSGNVFCMITGNKLNCNFNIDPSCPLEDAPIEKSCETLKQCSTCKHDGTLVTHEPCRACVLTDYGNWQPKTEE